MSVCTNQGALIGFLVSFGFNIWLTVGRLFFITSKTPFLPLSTEGCDTEGISSSHHNMIPVNESISTISPLDDDQK